MTPFEKLMAKLKEAREKSLAGRWQGIDFLADQQVTGELAVYLGGGPLYSSPDHFGIHHSGELGKNEQKFICLAANHMLDVIKANEILLKAVNDVCLIGAGPKAYTADFTTDTIGILREALEQVAGIGEENEQA